MRKVSKEAVMRMIEDFPGNTFAGVETLTSPKLKNTGRKTGLTLVEKVGVKPENLKKRSTWVAGLGYNYQKAVENRLIKEGKSADTYEKGTSWHAPYGDSKTIRQNKKSGELYFYIFANIANNPPKSEFIDVETGNLVNKDDLVEFLDIVYPSKNQGLEEANEIKPRTLKLESLKRLSFNGEVYEVIC